MTETATKMNITNFLQLCSGNWFSQRTNYSLVGEETASNKADISITIVDSEDSQITQLCQQHRFDPQQSVGGLLYSWDTSVDWGKRKQKGSSLLVFIADSQNDCQGKLIINNTSKPGATNSGSYTIGEDDAVTLTINTPESNIQERIWFASDNLKLRTTVIKNDKDITNTTFYSEIRKAPIKDEKA